MSGANQNPWSTIFTSASAAYNIVLANSASAIPSAFCAFGSLMSSEAIVTVLAKITEKMTMSNHALLAMLRQNFLKGFSSSNRNRLFGCSANHLREKRGATGRGVWSALRVWARSRNVPIGTIVRLSALSSRGTCARVWEGKKPATIENRW